MKNLLLLALLGCSTFAAAGTPAKKSPVLIEETHKGLGIDVGDSGFRIFEDGSYFVYVHDPKAMHVVDRDGKLADKEFADVKAALAKAPWKVTRSEVTCDALAAGHTLWAAGNHTFDEQICGKDSIDNETIKVLRLVDGLESKYAREKK